MIIFLYGSDTFRSKQKIKEIVEEYQKIHNTGLNFKILEKDIDFEDFKNEVFSFSMFKEKKLIILKNIFDNKKFKENLSLVIDSIKENKNTILIIWQEGEPATSDYLFKLLKKIAKTQEFKKSEGLFLKKWIKKEAEKLGGSIDIQAVDKLIDFVGNDSWRLHNEIQKLVAFKKKMMIQVKDVEFLMKPEIENNIFKTIDAIAEKNKKRAIQLVRQHLDNGESPLYLISMINFQFRNLLIVREMIERNIPYYLILKKSQLKPFLLQKTWKQSKQFSLSELKKIYSKIFKIDLEIKTGKIDPLLALDLLITRM